MCCMVSLLIASDHAKWTGHDAVAAAVADVLLHIDRVKFCTDNRACWTGFQAGSIGAMLAYIALHQPAVAVKERQRGSWRRVWNSAVASSLGYCSIEEWERSEE